MSNTVFVSNAAELRAALNTRGADTTIVLKDGHYGEFSFNARDSAIGIKLVAEHAGGGAVFASLTLANANGVEIDGVKFQPKDDAKFATGLNLRGCDGVVLTHNDFSGGTTAFANMQRGVFIDRSTGVVVEDNDFHGLGRGVVVSETDGIKILDNDIWNMRSEGLNLAGVKNVDIGFNEMKDFHPATGDHADFIQFWTTGTSTVSENIHIHDNVLIQKQNGLSVQGIFMDNDNSVAYKNVVIEDNTIQTGMPHGILLAQADGVVIRDNSVLSVLGSSYKVSIAVVESQDVTVTGNTATCFNIDGNVNLSAADNISVAKQVAADAPLSAQDVVDLRLDALSPVFGTLGVDKMTGTGGDDILFGLAGDDVINAGRGNDILAGGAGNDMLSGSAGADTFWFDGAALVGRETDRVMDLAFSDGDRLEFHGFGANVFKGLAADLFGNDSSGTYVAADSFADLAQMAKLDSVTMSRKGVTDLLIMSVKDADGDAVDIHISNAYTAYIQAGGQLV